MLVRMKVGISGTCNGKRWPAKGKVADLPASMAAHALANGQAVEVDESADADDSESPDPDVEVDESADADDSESPDPDVEVETAVAPTDDVETRETSAVTTDDGPVKRPRKKSAAKPKD